MAISYRQDGGVQSSGGAGGSTVASSTQVSISQLLDSSGGTIAAGDSANQAIKVNVVAGAAAGSTLVTVRQSTAGDLQATVTPVAGSTWRTQPGSTLWASSAGFHFDSSGALQIAGTFSASTTVNVSSLAGAVITRSSAADMLATVYQSSAADLNVTVAGYVAPSTTVSVSTGSMRVHQSTAADLNVTVAGYVAPSTTVSVSTVAGAVIMRSSAANALVSVYQSTAADLNVTVAGYVAPSTTVAVSTGSVRVHQSTATDLLARVNQGVGNSSAADAWQTKATYAEFDSTYVSGSKTSSGDTTLLSSAASTRFNVFGYHFTIDSTTPTLVRLMNGSTVEMARWQFRAPSSIAVGANLAVAPPAYLYRTAVANPLILHTDSTAAVHYSIQAFRST